MHRSKLFRALVIGGSMTAMALGGCGEETSANPATDSEQNQSASTDDSQTGDSTQVDENSEADATDNATETGNDTPSDTDATDPETETEPPDETDEPDSSSSEEEPSSVEGELAPCFCGSEASCCEEVDGEEQVIDGFECCWGTSC